MQNQQTQWRWLISSFLISVFTLVPVIVILTSLFAPTTSTWSHISSSVLPGYVGNTLLLMVQVALYTTVIGVGTAWLTAATEFPGRRILTWALMLPLAAPAYIVAYVYTDLLDYSGPVQTLIRSLTGLYAGEYYFPEIRSLSGAAFIISLVLYPYVYLLVRVAFIQRSATLYDAARTLGASPFYAFWRIALPAARPALVGGLALVLMETLADYGTVDYFAVPTFSTGIFRTWFSMGDKAAALKLAAVMFSFVVLLIVIEKYNRRPSQAQAIARDGNLQRTQLTGLVAAGATLLCVLPVVLGSLIPGGTLAYFALTTGDPLLGHGFTGFIGNSLQVALSATLAAVIIALVLTYAKRLTDSKAVNLSIQLSTLGYALPGALLAVGLFAPVSQFDRAIATFFDEQFDIQTGLLLTGTVAIVVYAYVVRFLTVAFNSTNSGMEAIPPIYDQAARSLGATPWRVLKSIHLPLMSRSILAAGIFVFVDSMRELPATLLLRPFDFETLATRVYKLASDERIAEASTASLLIVVIGLVPVLLLNKLSDKR